MSAKPAPTPTPTPAPLASNKRLYAVIAGLLVLVLVLGLVAAFFLLQPPADDELDPFAPPTRPAPAAPAPVAQPTFKQLENMVVNLADPGAARFAQVGVSLQLANPASAARVEAFMPVIRHGMLRLIARRTAAELLTPEGKDALAADMLAMIREVTGLPGRNGQSPVQAVLFTSLIVQ